MHQPVNEIVSRNAAFADGFAVDSLTLFLLQPLKEIVKGSVKRTKTGFKAVGKHADLIERKEVGNVLDIAFQIFPIGFFHLDDAVFELDKHKGQTVYKYDPGDFFGSRQSGLPTFRVANLSFDLQTLKDAQSASAKWIDESGTSDAPEAVALRARIGELFRRAEGTMN